MRAGEFPDGAHVLRAKIDMAHPNMIMRDPLLLRIRHAPHYRRGDAWCIYPLYDFAHGLSRRDRGDHALALHARVQGQPRHLRLARARGGLRAPARADRVRAARARLHGAEQAKAAAAREREARGGLGRSAHADDRRPASSRRDARRRCARSPRRSACARKPARTELATFEHAVRDDLNMRVPRVMCVLESAQGRAHELSGRIRSKSSTRRTTRTTCR